MGETRMTREELESALGRLGLDASEARLDALLPDAQTTSGWLDELLALDVEGHEPSTLFRPGGL